VTQDQDRQIARDAGPRATGDSPARDRADRIPPWLVGVIPALAELVIGGYKLGGPSLWRDEGYTINSSQRSVSQILALTWHQDAVHGLYYLLIHFVIGAFGTSAVVLRLPSLLAMCLAAAVTAVLGQRLARASGLPAPSVTGIGAGLLLAAVPLTTYYSEDARPYGLVSLLGLTATYALVRGAAEYRWRWWVLYIAAIVLAVTLDLFALLLVVAHGVSLVFARTRAPAAMEAPAGDQPAAGQPGARVPGAGRPGAGRPGRPLAQWLVAVAAAVVVLAPVLYLGYRQAGTLDWIRAPDRATVIGLVRDLAGAGPLIPLVAVLAVCGAAANRRSRRGALTLPVVALPWLVLPPVLLLAVSELHPVYTERYVLYCFPALSLLVAAGLARITALTSGRSFGQRSRVLAVLPSAVLATVLAVSLIGPQLGIRITSHRTDDLRTVTAIVAAHERPGDVVFYLPQTTRVVGMAYPAPFRRLRDIALGQSPASSGTLLGVEVPGSVLARRLAGVRRIWTVNWRNSLTPLSSDGLASQEEGQVSHMRLVQQWYVMSVVLRLYTVSQT
jgi:mannosyltransferase